MLIRIALLIDSSVYCSFILCLNQDLHMNLKMASSWTKLQAGCGLLKMLISALSNFCAYWAEFNLLQGSL